MRCPTCDTDVLIHPQSIDILGFGTYLMYCPVCLKVYKNTDPNVYKNSSFFFSFKLSESEEKLIMRGLEVMLRQERTVPTPKQYCRCTACEEVFRVVRRPISAQGILTTEHGEKIAYIYKKDGLDICRCIACNQRNFVFENDILRFESDIKF